MILLGMTVQVNQLFIFSLIGREKEIGWGEERWTDTAFTLISAQKERMCSFRSELSSAYASVSNNIVLCASFKCSYFVCYICAIILASTSSEKIIKTLNNSVSWNKHRIKSCGENPLYWQGESGTGSAALTQGGLFSSSNRNPALSEIYLFMPLQEACICLHLWKERETLFITILSNPSSSPRTIK